ncbi:MAG: YdiU family protein [Deltaproteobacteria bacterium]|nr:YdiU family protein [Deltaproteobacteria bacterium]
MELTNTYAELLPERFFERAGPYPVQSPRLLLWNTPLADALGVARTWSADPNRMAQHFSGNTLIAGSRPIALAYAGHQFGHFVPQLGDGRAHLLGEIVDPFGRRFDVQLKGSGCSMFSRNGDGRCALGPALREYIMSEAMHALGVPTTRSLAVVATGEVVHRETPRPGAIVTRVASSHIRVGTFEFFAARRDLDGLRKLADFAIDRHDRDLLPNGEPDRWLAFFDRVVDRQIRLVVEWMRVGFIHGVMNTDNTSVAGETIDYGPCAMMGIYDPRTVYSSIDVHGRYAFGNQPKIAAWNLARLAECILPLVDADEQTAIRKLEPI